MPAIVGTASSETQCLSCLDSLENMALRCSKCEGFTHLRCSEMPDYQLVRFAVKQITYMCRACVRTKELEEDKYEEELETVLELMKREQHAIEMNKLDSTKDENEIISEITTDSPRSEEIRSSPRSEEIGSSSRSEETVLPTETNLLDRQNNQRPNLTSPNNLPVNRSGNEEKISSICKFYLKKECKHGRLGTQCKYDHPKICPNFAKNGDRRGGCSRKANCRFYHPKLCWQFLEERECIRMKCRYYHLNGTSFTYDVNPHQDIQQENRRIFPQQRSNIRTYSEAANNFTSQQVNSSPQVTNPLEKNGRYNTPLNNPDFHIMDKRMQRLESMMYNILQSVRPPGSQMLRPEQ